MQRQGVDSRDVGRGVVAFVEHNGHIRDSAEACRSRHLLQEPAETLDHHGKLLRIVGVALIEIVVDRHMAVTRAEQRVADLAQVAPALLVLAAAGEVAMRVERIDETVEVRAVVAETRQVNLFPFKHALDDLLPQV